MDNFYIIYGDDDNKIKRRSVSLAKNFADINDENASDNLSSDDCETEIISADAKNLNEVYNEIINALIIPPFLTPKKTVFVRYFKDLDKLINHTNKLAESLFNTIINGEYDKENINLIIEAPQVILDARKANFKKLQKIATFEKFEHIKITDKNFIRYREEYIREAVAKNGKKIRSDALKFLSESIASDSAILDNELEKIFIYLDNDIDITLDLCKKLCAKTPESLTYLFTNALLLKDLKNSIILLDVLIDNGEVEMRIMSTISSELQKIMQTRLAMEELNISRVHARTFDGIDPSLKTQFPSNFLLKQHPFRAFKLCEGASMWDKSALAKALKITSQSNLSIVSGVAAPRAILEQLVFGICTI